MLSVNLLNSYTGLNQGSAAGPNTNPGFTIIYSPPDTCGAAGTTSYVQTSNQGIRIFPDKTSSAGAITDSADDFWFTQGGLTRLTPVNDPKSIGFTNNLSDITVVWDDQVQRFIIGDQDVNFTTHTSDFNIAISKSANPATLTNADWSFYQINTTQKDHDADYPGNMGYNRDAFVFTLNQFGVGGASTHVQITAVSINDLVAGVASPNVVQNDIDSNTLRPVVMHDSVAGGPMWFVAEGGSNKINVVKMDNPLSTTPTFTTTSLGVNAYSGPVAAKQPDGTTIPPASGDGATDGRIQKAAEFNNNIVACQAIRASDTEDDVRWYSIDVSGATPTLADQGNVSAGDNTYLVYPSIDVNARGDIGMTYLKSGTDANDFMAMYVTGRNAGDAAGTMQTPVLVQSGATNNTDGREGDLSGINVDSTPITSTAPSDQNAVEGASHSFNLGSFTDFEGDFWGTNEFAASGGSWGTAIGHFNVGTTGPWSVDVDWGDSTTHGTSSVTTPGSLGTSNHTFAEEGTYAVTVKITDSADGHSDSKTFTVTVSDPAVVPTAVPINAIEGQDTGSVAVATFTDPGGPEPVADYSASIDWGDGSTSTGTITLSSGTYTVSGNHTYAEESAPDHPGSDPYVILVTISHETAPQATVNSSATVSDPAVVATGGFNFTAVEGTPSATQTVATFTDPGGTEPVGDYSALIDWGDGTAPSPGTITLSGGVYTVQGSHTYATGLGLPDDFGNSFCDANPPHYTKPITVTISHENAPTSVAHSTATISLPPDSAHLAGGSLIIVGTTGDDQVLINPVGNTGAVQVFVNSGNLGTFTLAANGRIIVAALAGNDDIQVAGGVRIPSVLYGGPGNDRIKGGGGKNIEVGCDGNDFLIGGNAGDLLIGGDGTDRIVGGQGADILVAGNIVDPMLNEDTKFSDLVNVLNGGPIHALGDGGQDSLTGGGGADTFYYHFLGTGPFDRVTGNGGVLINI